jgi:hypothetical protein
MGHERGGAFNEDQRGGHADPPCCLTIENQTDKEVTYTVTPLDRSTVDAQADLAYAIGRLLSHYLIDFSPAGVRISGQAPLDVYGAMERLRRLAAGGSEKYAAKAPPTERAVAEEVGIGPGEVGGHFAYGIVDRDGDPYIDESCIFGEPADAQSEADSLNDGGDEGHRVVELRWTPPGPKKFTDPPPPTEPRFGERLRAALGMGEPDDAEVLTEWYRIADAIDQDQEEQCARLVQRRLREQADIRQKVEQLVEELRYGVHLGMASHDKDVLTAEPFLERLAKIFEGKE